MLWPGDVWSPHGRHPAFIAAMKFRPLAFFILFSCASVHGASSSPAAAIAQCESSCQASQRAALTLLYTGTVQNGNWSRPASYVNGTAIPITQWGFSYAIPGLALPIHCYWAGVICCDPAGYITLATGYSYVASGQISCNVAYGVTTLLLLSNNITGRVGY